MAILRSGRLSRGSFVRILQRTEIYLPIVPQLGKCRGESQSILASNSSSRKRGVLDYAKIDRFDHGDAIRRRGSRRHLGGLQHADLSDGLPTPAAMSDGLSGAGSLSTASSCSLSAACAGLSTARAGSLSAGSNLPTGGDKTGHWL